MDEVSRLIEGLKDGSLPADYVGRRSDEIDVKYGLDRESEAAAPGAPAVAAAAAAVAGETARGAAVEGVAAPSLPGGPVSSGERQSGARGPRGPASRQAAAAEPEELTPERRAELMVKVEELQGRMRRKEAARKRHAEYVRAKEADGTARYAGTDYSEWDLWCPSDEEDELVRGMAPDNAEFSAMEKDIEERHQSMLRSRRAAERCREGGNAAFRTGQWAEALRLYEEGCSHEKSNFKLHANAAAAALKLGCSVGAVEHCDKVLSIIDFLHENKPSLDGHRVKALFRRGKARLALGHARQALADLEQAAGLGDGGEDREVAALLAKARRSVEEEGQARTLRDRVAAGHEAGNSGGREGVQKLRLVEKYSKALWELLNAPGSRGGGDGGGQGGEAEGAASANAAVAKQDIPSASPGGRAFANDTGMSGAEEASQGDGAASGQAAAVSRAKVEGRAAFVLRQLEKLLLESADCRVYARDCGALATLERAALGRDAAKEWDEVEVLDCLRAACQTDSIAEAVAGRQPLLARCSSLVELSGDGGRAVAAAGAAAKLMQTCSAAEGARPGLAAHFAEKPRAVNGLAELLDVPSEMSGGASAAALTFLSNILTQPSMKQALETGRLDYRGLTQRAALILLPQAGSQGAKGTGGGPSSSTASPETAAALLSNACGSAGARAHLAGIPGFVAGVVGLLSPSEGLLAAGGGGGRAGGKNKKVIMPSGSKVPAASVLALLANILVEETGRTAFQEAGGPARLRGVLADPLLPTPTFARAALVLARWAKQPGAVAEANALGGSGSPSLLSRVLQRLHTLLPACGAFPRGGPADIEAADQALRFIALCLHAGTESTAAALSGGAPEVLLRALAATAMPDSAVGNAALALGDLAREAEGLQALETLNAVAPLVEVTRRREGAAAKRNSAIAIAQLARSPRNLERIRELRALEIIAALGAKVLH